MMRPTERRCLGCHAPVIMRHVTCFKCWFRLPLELRERLGMGRSVTAAADTVLWFKNNPEEGKS
jgi:hypothetical protein